MAKIVRFGINFERGYVAVVSLSGKVWINSGGLWKVIEVPCGPLRGMAGLNVVIVKGIF